MRQNNPKKAKSNTGEV